MTTRYVCSILVVAVALALNSATAATADDIVCSAKKARFAVPGACQRACVGGGLRNFIGCAFAPTCPVFQGDQQLAVFYNQALFNRGPIRGEQARRVLVSHLITRYLRPHRASDVNIALRNTTDFWAVLDYGSETEKPTLVVADDLFWLTPAFVATTIGHEIGHYEQLARAPRLHPILTPLVKAFRELEASTWELNLSPSSFSFGSNPFLACLQDQERRDLEVSLRCSDWDTRELLERYGIGAAASRYGEQLRSWLAADPWISRNWLPTHGDWQTRTLESRPPDCQRGRKR